MYFEDPKPLDCQKVFEYAFFKSKLYVLDHSGSFDMLIEKLFRKSFSFGVRQKTVFAVRIFIFTYFLRKSILSGVSRLFANKQVQAVQALPCLQVIWAKN